MSILKTRVNDNSVHDFLNVVPDEAKRIDSFQLLALFEKITGLKPKMWGASMVGFGSYHYKSERSSQEGDWLLTGFSPRKQALTLYILSGFPDQEALLNKLGKHSTGVGCLYIKKLADIDMEILEKMISASFVYMKQLHT